MAVLAAVPGRLRDAGVRTAVPSFASLMAVQDKVSAFSTLGRLGLPQPASAVDPAGWDRFPAFVKQPIGTASGGVRRVRDVDELGAAAASGPVLVQEAVPGPLAMGQAVFGQGSLLAFHANLRVAEGPNGGASHKRGLAVPALGHWMAILGSVLSWHGALSADVILSDRGPRFIDVNPRLVEPANAWLSGVDLVGAMLEVADAGSEPSGPWTGRRDGRPGVASHQLLLAVLGAAQGPRARRAVAGELVGALTGTGRYRNSREELTPLHRDLRAAAPTLAASVAALLVPGASSWFTSGSVANYALTAAGWSRIVAEAAGRSPPDEAGAVVDTDG